MISAAFIFLPGEYDKDFHRLDASIARAAEATPGYLGKERWHAEDGRINAVYYWQHQEGLHAFAKHPKHVEAKRQYARWYRGFHIVISEVLHSYGDGALSHVTSSQRSI